MVMGHELTHGFDNAGRQYDKDGNLRDWWTQSSLDNFLDRTQCIINQYDQYTVGKKNVSMGIFSIEIADLKELNYILSKQQNRENLVFY